MKGFTIFWRIVAVIAFAAAVGVTILIISTLILRTDYKETAYEINQAAAAHLNDAVISRDGTSLPATADVIDYYDRVLLDSTTVVFSSDDAAENEQTIRLDLGNRSLSFTGLEDGSAILVRWTTPDGRKIFRVRSQTTFMQLTAYYTNYEKRTMSS